MLLNLFTFSLRIYRLLIEKLKLNKNLLKQHNDRKLTLRDFGQGNPSSVLKHFAHLSRIIASNE